MRTIIVLFALAALFATLIMAGTAAAKDWPPLRAEISGAGLTSPITIEGPLTAETVFLNDSVEVPAPATLEPAYTIKLMPAEPDDETGGYPVMATLTYFPGEGDEPGLLSGDWDSDRHFKISTEFESILNGAIEAATRADGDEVGAVWYIAPSLALGVVLISGFAGRRLLMRRNGD